MKRALYSIKRAPAYHFFPKWAPKRTLYCTLTTIREFSSAKNSPIFYQQSPAYYQNRPTPFSKKPPSFISRALYCTLTQIRHVFESTVYCTLTQILGVGLFWYAGLLWKRTELLTVWHTHTDSTRLWDQKPCSLSKVPFISKQTHTMLKQSCIAD